MLYSHLSCKDKYVKIKCNVLINIGSDERPEKLCKFIFDVNEMRSCLVPTKLLWVKSGYSILLRYTGIKIYSVVCCWTIDQTCRQAPANQRHTGILTSLLSDLLPAVSSHLLRLLSLVSFPVQGRATVLMVLFDFVFGLHIRTVSYHFFPIMPIPSIADY